MEQFLHYVTTDHDARILFPAMVVLGLFVLYVFGGRVRRATRSARLKRGLARRQKRNFKRLQKTGQITNASARQQARQARNWAREAQEKFGDNTSDSIVAIKS